MKKIGGGALVLLYLLMIPAVWFGLAAMPRPDRIYLYSQDGSFDLTDKDFAQALYILSDYWQSYPGKLYTPEDFAARRVTEAPRFLEGSDYQGENAVQFATHRALVKLCGR